MSDDEYERWSQRHLDIFGLNTERYAAMVAAWRDVFHLAGYAADELESATTWLAAFKPPRFASEHLPAIQGRITEQRCVRARANQALEEAAAANQPCRLCQGYGWVVVPKRASVIDGQWTTLSGATLPTSGVCCDCPAGCRIYASHTKPKFIDQGHKPPMRLFEYENHVPHWEQLMQRKEQELNARGRAWQAAKDADAVVRQVKE